VDKERLRRKVAYVDRACEQLESVLALGEARFRQDELVQAAAMRYLQTAIEAVLDMAHHVVARQQLGVPQNYRDVMRLFFATGLVPEEKRESYLRMVSFRNRLVHLYDAVDPEEVFGIIAAGLNDLRAFVAAVVRAYLSDTEAGG
jgi:uncharacterized protein YutE (UPF0331/DUF86 family)